MEKTFSTSGAMGYDKDDNEVLKKDLRDWNKLGAHLYPAVSINGVKFRGTVNPDNVFEAICMGFISMPQPCRKFLRKEGIRIENRQGLSTNMLIYVMVSIVVINLVLFMFYRKHLSQELNQELKI